MCSLVDFHLKKIFRDHPVVSCQTKMQQAVWLQWSLYILTETLFKNVQCKQTERLVITVLSSGVRPAGYYQTEVVKNNTSTTENEKKRPI